MYPSPHQIAQPISPNSIAAIVPTTALLPSLIVLPEGIGFDDGLDFDTTCDSDLYFFSSCTLKDYCCLE